MSCERLERHHYALRGGQFLLIRIQSQELLRTEVDGGGGMQGVGEAMAAGFRVFRAEFPWICLGCEKAGQVSLSGFFD